MSAIPWIVITLMVLMAVGYILWERHRTEAFQGFAAARAMTYTKRDDRWVRVDLGYPYGAGSSHKAKHVLTGVHEGRPFVVFEHHWVTGSGDDRESHQAMVTAIEMPRSFPRLTVGREGVLSSVVRRLGVKDIELESDDFNRTFRVGGDRRFAYDVLHPRFMHWLLETDDQGFVIIDRYIATQRNGYLKTEDVDPSVSRLTAVIDHIPPFVWTA